jgi:hypothetical protein
MIVEGFNTWWRIANVGDVERVEAELSTPDRCELQAGGITLMQSVERALEAGGLVFTMVDHDDGDAPGGVFGFTPWHEVGLVWALTTPRIRKHRRRFLRISAQWVDWVNAICPIVGNTIWAGSLQHIFWLLSMGFVIVAEREVNGEPYYEFVRLRRHV